MATTDQKQAFKSSIQVRYIQAIVDQLNDRFPNVQLLETFSIFDSQALPSDEEELPGYGQDKLKTLRAIYGEGPT